MFVDRVLQFGQHGTVPEQMPESRVGFEVGFGPERGGCGRRRRGDDRRRWRQFGGRATSVAILPTFVTLVHIE